MTAARVSKSGRGRGLEGVLNLAHGLYLARYGVLVKHYGISGRYLPGPGGKPRFIPFPKDQQPVDYHGCLLGRLIVFDAKEARDPHWRLDTRYTHQYDRLRGWARSGALAWFAVEFVPIRVLWLLRIRSDSPWPIIDFSSAPPDSDLLGLPANDEGWYDWLPRVRREWL